MKLIVQLAAVALVGSVLAGCGPSGQPINLADLRGTALGGQPVGSSTSRSAVLVLNVFGSWCPPCIAEADGFAAAYDKYESRGVHFVGVAEKETSKANVRAFIAAHHLDYPVLYDANGQIALNVVPQAGIPTTYIFRRGELVYRIPGSVEYTTLVTDISKALE